MSELACRLRFGFEFLRAWAIALLGGYPR